MNNELKKLKEYFEDVASNWNGDESGIGEDRGAAAYEALDLISEIEDILLELK